MAGFGVVDWMMTNVSSVLVLICLALLSYYFLSRWQRYRTLPPGPWPWPIVGNALLLVGNPNLAMLKLKQKYGDIVTLYLGSRPCVFLLSHDVIKEALVNNSYALHGRPTTNYFVREVFGVRGIATTEGDLWKDQQRLAMKYMKEEGMGRAKMDGNIQDEAEHLIEELLKSKGKPIDPCSYIQLAMANIVHMLMFGRRCSYDDATFREALDKFAYVLDNIADNNPLNLASWLSYLPGDPFKSREIKRIWNEYAVYYEKETQSKIQSYDGTIRDYADAYIEEMQKGRNTTSFNEKQMVGSLVDLMGGGSDTAKTIFTWAIALLLNYPDVLNRVTAEIDDVIGGEHIPCNNDRINMQYTEAVILEVMRIRAVGPFSFPHKTLEDVTIKGYRLPADTEVLVALGLTQCDVEVWKEPDVFKPERFLNTEGQVVDSCKVLVFSMGRRSCPGEQLARTELFIFLTMLLQRVSISNPPGCPPPDLSPTFGILCHPAPYKVVFSTREPHREP